MPIGFAAGDAAEPTARSGLNAVMPTPSGKRLRWRPLSRNCPRQIQLTSEVGNRRRSTDVFRRTKAALARPLPHLICLLPAWWL